MGSAGNSLVLLVAKEKGHDLGDSASHQGQLSSCFVGCKKQVCAMTGLARLGG